MLGTCHITTNPSTPNMSGLKPFKQFRWCRSQQNNPTGQDFEPSIISGVDGRSSEQSVSIRISLNTTWLLTLVGMTIWRDCAKILCSYSPCYLIPTHGYSGVHHVSIKTVKYFAWWGHHPPKALSINNDHNDQWPTLFGDLTDKLILYT